MEKRMKVLFLDFDGVLNSDLYVRAHPSGGVVIDPSRLELLSRIVARTGARIVLTTSWRDHWDPAPERRDAVGEEIVRIFGTAGLAVFGKTPRLGDREKEIAAWLGEHPETEAFAVLDDRPYEEGFLRGSFVLTSGLRHGLDGEDAEKAIRILNGTAEEEEPPRGTLVSILGDSVSALDGYQPYGYEVYYTAERAEETGIYGASDMWWGKVLGRFGWTLCVNGSYSGSFTAGSSSLSAHSARRIGDLKDGERVPDAVFVCMGANDCGGRVPLRAPRDGRDGAEENAFDAAYALMLDRIRASYPDAAVFCVTVMLTEAETADGRERARERVNAYDQVIRDVCREKGCVLIDLYDETCGYPTADGLHPDRSGQELIARKMISVLENVMPDKKSKRHVLSLDSPQNANYNK